MKNSPDDSTQIARGLHPLSKQKIPLTILPESPRVLEAPVGFINPGSLMGLLPSKKLGLADDVADGTQLLGWPRYLTIGRKSDPVSDRKAWPKSDLDMSEHE